MTTAERAAASFLSNIPARDPNAPGQFAFADRQRVSRILEESGWAGIDLRPVDVACAFPEKDLVRYFTQLGPSAGCFTMSTSQLARGSSNRCAPLSIRTCTAMKSVLAQPAGESALDPRARRRHGNDQYLWYRSLCSRLGLECTGRNQW